ncbi:hypothetical protein [Pseudogracilibacillus auburnensis]|uniref:hypothetical protein n=1 Tax=Pseudogracilibacillus auburnensis TaxID=1494959 RepID=UPI001A96EB10|nr:hypothetical protein [Pseudogracilibacillus auburnensis]MBO1002529.1 hypothetical protein [Pseudogracilibacillus auburnensis]
MVISLFFILPIVSIIREIGYLITSKIFGAKKSKITIGSGPKLFHLSVFEVRKYYFAYSWCSYDSLRNESKLAHIIIYASPILSNLLIALLINGLLAYELLGLPNFWNKFVFYSFYFVLFDALPIYYPDGQPSNGRVIYNLLRYGRKSDFERNDPQIDIKKTDKK